MVAGKEESQSIGFQHESVAAPTLSPTKFESTAQDAGTSPRKPAAPESPSQVQPSPQASSAESAHNSLGNLPNASNSESSAPPGHASSAATAVCPTPNNTNTGPKVSEQYSDAAPSARPFIRFRSRAAKAEARLSLAGQQGERTMELHDASGTLLQPFPEPDQPQGQSQVHTPQQAQQQHELQVSQQEKSEPQDLVAQQSATDADAAISTPLPNPSTLPERAGTEAVSSGMPTVDIGNVGSLQQGGVVSGMALPKKPTRMPGTKQCPSCHNTIAAAVAKCPKCPHVFREKKEKIKRSGKRGKKNCPKCQFENPSACSSCKNCKHVFRLKLMDKYKAMRPRQTNESVAAAAAAAAHAAANMAHVGGTAVTAVSTVPLPAGVATYPSQIGQNAHPAHAAVSVIPPLGQHPMAMHQHTHNVHSAGMPVPQMHPMPSHPMQQQHPHQQL